MAQLHFLSGPLVGKRIILKGRTISLGREPGNNIRLEDASVAPRHAVLVREDDEYTLYIDASKPPVAINGKQIVNETLKNGDLLQIGLIRVRYSAPSSSKSATARPALPVRKPPQEILSLDDAEELPFEKEGGPWKRLLNLALLLALMLGGGLLLLRNERVKETPVVVQPKPDEMPVPKEIPTPVEPLKEDELALGTLPIGIGGAGWRDGAKIHRTKNFKSHQDAVNAAQPGDAVIFDSPDSKPIVLVKPLRDVQFLSGSAAWELHADLIDCQFFFHETRQFLQRAGRLERCVFFRCPVKQTHLIHADAVSFYFDERTPLHPKDNPDGGRTPALFLSGFVRNVLLLKPLSGVPNADNRYDMRWSPSIRIDATDPEEDGRGTYILSPVVLGQRAWTPHEITRGNGITYAHLTTDFNNWADPVLDILHGNDCVLLANSFGADVATTSEQYGVPPKKLKYHDHDEFGHDNGPAYRGACMSLAGQRNRIVAHGDARKPWTVGRKMALPGLHYADGVAASDPFISQFATEQGGLSVNFAEEKSVFVQQTGKDGSEDRSSPEQPDGRPLNPRDGPDLHRPMFVPLKDLRLNAGEFDKQTFVDMSGKSVSDIEKALMADKSIILGPGTYEMTQTVKAGMIVGAGLEKTILKWPDGIDCCQRNCRGILNCTISGGRFGYNSQAGTGGRLDNPGGLFLRTRFAGQKEAGVNLHTSKFQTWQDCEFVGCRTGFTHGLDKSPGVYKGDKGTMGGITIDNLNLCNCTFRELKLRAIDLTPDSPRLGHVAIHNCSFESIGDSAIRIEGGQTHLVQACRLQACGGQSYAPAVAIVSTGTVTVSHLDVDCRGVKGNPLCVSLKGLAAASRCNIRGMPTSLRCEGLLAADRIIGDGNLQANPGSLMCRCRFKNMELPDGTAVAKEGDFADVSALMLPTAVIDKTPPPAVSGQRVRSVNKLKKIDWEPVEDPESGVSGYIVLSDGKEIARVGWTYEPPSDFHSPLFRIIPPTTYTDPNPANRNYEVLAVNGAGITSAAKEAPLRRIGPARARYLTKDGDAIGIKDFINVKGKVTQISDDDGNKLPLEKVGIKGMPNIVYLEIREIVDLP